ncbi:DUF3656 domain-containing U32 family peptidase [Roseimaritima sediminicola]|uniref:DUF3656 domain-containing U32 family peptidase n=1 Tax=Roseimaritima sediminicola TaxID=2662066 RepID=UPI00129838D1|nr:U32 family peptidase [Roseimaritima sediminicola]
MSPAESPSPESPTPESPTAKLPRPELPRPELLAPAGQWDCLTAAIENGADAVYFGLDCGFNARARASNFHVDELDRVVETLHRRGVAGYVTVNTLVFADELPQLEKVLRRIARSGVDAILVQDFGVARLAREVCPDLDIHASTQMTLTSAETIAVAQRLGIKRVVLAREMSLKEIRQVRGATEMPLEVFIHGALCVAYSGQCLTSESLGGRSANRGQCAQACRLPYELICDGEDRDLGDVRYLLSPQDLAGYAAIPDLIDAGVCSLKIEGRLKTPEYVANITSHYRDAIDQAMQSRAVNLSPQAVDEMELSFSRGFSLGWLNGCDHKMLVPGEDSAKRGILLGVVKRVTNRSVVLELWRPLSLGDGLGFEGGREDGTQQGGRVFGLQRGGKAVQRADGQDREVEVLFGKGGIDFNQLYVGQRVWKSDDPDLNRRLRKSYQNEDPQTRRPIDLEVHAVAGEPLRVTARDAFGRTATAVGDAALEVARNRAADEAALEEKLGRLGGTPYRLGRLAARIQGGPMVPVSLLNQLRRALVADLQQQAATPPPRQVREGVLADLRATAEPTRQATDASAERGPRLAVMCRNLEQLAAVAQAGIETLYVDFHDVRQYGEAVSIAHANNARLAIGSVRIQKPGEMGLLKVLRRHQPDGILCRNLAAIQFCQDEGIEAIADFSMNIVNDLSARWMRSLGVSRITPSYDLNREQLMDLVDAVPAEWLEIVIHQHMPMFHMEHCVFCSVMSPGTNKTNCGRPCDRHVVQLRDRIGTEHPLHADVACRNTLYNAVPQSAAEATGELVAGGVRQFRIELLEQSPAEAVSIVNTYRQLLAGEKSGSNVWQELKALNRVGVTRGTLEAKRNPLAII